MKVQDKIDIIKKEGIENLCIISDFDDTITKGINEQGKKCSNSFNVFINNPQLLGTKINQELKDLYNYYYPIEQNPNLSKEEKTKFMVQWWIKTFDTYKQNGFCKDTIKTIVDNKLLELKDKSDEFLDICVKNNIDTVIFSAGFYNLIHKFLELNHVDHKNIHVVANKLKFDEKGNFTHLYGDIIHSMNKNFTELSRIPVYEELKKRKTCIILGDSLSDCYMADGSGYETILKIGFLNALPQDSDYQTRYDAHKTKFDIVLNATDDFSSINQILKQIIQ